MKQSAWLAAVLLVSVGGAFAASSVEQAGTSVEPSPGTLAAPATPTTPELHRQALEELRKEREAFVRQFDWNAGPRAEREAGFQEGMSAFDGRELLLKREFYSASGQLELLAQVERSLAARAQRGVARPELGIRASAQGKEEVK